MLYLLINIWIYREISLCLQKRRKTNMPEMQHHRPTDITSEFYNSLIISTLHPTIFRLRFSESSLYKAHKYYWTC